MIPRRFVTYMERSLGRPLTPAELEVLRRAREECETGKRDSVKAMRAALEEYWERNPGKAGSRRPPETDK